MTILVTGGSGLIGSSIKELIGETEDFIFLSSKDCDLRNLSEIESIFQKYSPSKVIHLASLVAGLYGNIDNNYRFLIDNLKINTNILDCCEKFKVKRLINVLSTCIFPDQNVTYPLTSDQILNGKPHESNSGYAYAKRMLYIGSKLLCKNSNIEIINLIPTNLYGKNDNYDLHKSHVIPGLIHKIYLAKQNKKPLIIKGTGNAKRQFIYSEDLSKIILNFVDLKLIKNYNELIIGPDINQEISIKEVISKLTKLIEFNGKIIYDTDYQDGQKLKTVDSKELLSYLPLFVFTKIDNGLQQTVNYFIENYTSSKNLRKGLI